MVLLLLLFAFALLQFYTSGFGAFATICVIPAVIAALMVLLIKIYPIKK